MPTLDATVGGATSNSYVDVSSADEYFDNRLHTATWDAASADDRARSLIMATTGLDYRIDWDGIKADTEQALAWPRDGLLDDDGNILDDESLPVELTNATCDYALILLDNDLTGLPGTAGVKSLKADVVTLEFDKSDLVDPVPDEVFTPLMKWASKRGDSLEAMIERA